MRPPAHSTHWAAAYYYGIAMSTVICKLRHIYSLYVVPGQVVTSAHTGTVTSAATDSSRHAMRPLPVLAEQPVLGTRALLIDGCCIQCTGRSVLTQLLSGDSGQNNFLSMMSSDKQDTTGNDFLEKLQVSSQVVLETAQKKGRSICPKCNSSRMFYCYTCYVPVESVPTSDIPTVKLPVKIDIIKHPNETDGKSTAAHAKLLAHEDVTVYTYPSIPDYDKQIHEVVLVFPGPNAVSLKDGLQYLPQHKNQKKDFTEPNIKRQRLDRCDNEEKNVTDAAQGMNCLRKVIFIDSTWNQTNKIISDERLQGLVNVELKERKTCFWRHQKGSPDTYLSTIEAIYYFMVDFHIQILEKDYKGEYDNLLFFFTFMYKLIRDAKQAAGKL
ncbi:tRNA-uridine aminocarboxypropyltransferase 1 [Engystomops pustulosus]|uniref:tRNA-uridine aminocarboxypropyltransferase 1 n=1 Tax=Engystomops pustulosus TaxID=76066 RepID=UPI003AFB1AE2